MEIIRNIRGWSDGKRYVETITMLNSLSSSMIVTIALDISIGSGMNGDDISTINTSSPSTMMSSMISISVQASVAPANIEILCVGDRKSAPTNKNLSKLYT